MSEQRIPERRRCPVCGNEGYMLDEPTVDNRIRQLEAENARLRRQVEAWEQAAKLVAISISRSPRYQASTKDDMAYAISLVCSEAEEIAQEPKP